MESYRSGLELRSLVTHNGLLTLSLEKVETPEPAIDEVIVRVEASPINPSDLGRLLGAADMTTATVTGSGIDTVVAAQISGARLSAMTARIGQSLAVGNEGAGIVVAAGASRAAQALLGKAVGAAGGAMYSQYRCLKVSDCLPLPPGTTPADGASCFVNPLTALGMVETMRREGHTALVHTAAASNLGQMLNRLCLKDGVGLVNIVRSDEQVELLRGMGAAHVCISASPTFLDQLTDAIAATGATLAFDAVGGGKLAGQILTCMEAAISRNAKGYNIYGSTVHKQVYIYGALDLGPTEFRRNFGMTWGMGGWLLTPFLQKIDQATAIRLRERVAAELKTTFVSRYTREISLSEALQLDVIAGYNRKSTGEKYLINPNKGARS